MGLVHIYHGEGKGKTTCSIGLSIRALGANFNVLFVQFLKGGETCELDILKNLDNLHIFRCEKDYNFTWLLTDEEKVKLKQDHNELLNNVINKADNISGNLLIVFDELCATHRLNLIDREKIELFIKNRRDNVEIVLTGRDPEKELLDLADYISEIKKIRHPMDVGICARKGIEV